MSISSQIKKLEQYEVKHRSAFERLGSLILTAVTVYSLTGLGHEHTNRNLNRAERDVVALQSVVFNPAEKSNETEKNETVRMPVKFDDGLRATATTTP